MSSGTESLAYPARTWAAPVDRPLWGGMRCRWTSRCRRLKDL